MFQGKAAKALLHQVGVRTGACTFICGTPSTYGDPLDSPANGDRDRVLLDDVGRRLNVGDGLPI